MTTELTRNDPIVFHFRLGRGKDVEPKSGATVVFLPESRRFGVALCCYKDRYCKRWGRKIATERARKGRAATPAGCVSVSRLGEPLPVRRFVSSPAYNGLLNMKDVQASAQALAYYAAEKVGNPLVSQGSLFIAEGEKAALKNIGLNRTVETTFSKTVS